MRNIPTHECYYTETTSDEEFDAFDDTSEVQPTANAASFDSSLLEEEHG